MKKRKYYYVWKGSKTGHFDNWPDCQKATKGVPGTQFLSFSSREKAEEASRLSYDEALLRRMEGEL